MKTVQTLDRLDILIVAYNHDRYIRQCLESFEPFLLRGARLSILDDGSSDGTALVVDAFRAANPGVQFLRQAHEGRVSVNAQRLLSATDREYIVTMSGDDLIVPDRGLDRAVDSLDRDPALAMVMPRLVHLPENEPAQSSAWCEPALLRALRSGDPSEVLQSHLDRMVSRIFLQGMVIRRSVIEGFTGFDVDLEADDYAFNLRMFRYMRDKGLYFQLDESALWLYRLHACNAHRDPVRQFSLIAGVVHKYIGDVSRRDFKWDAVLIEDVKHYRDIRIIAFSRFDRSIAAQAISPSIRLSLRYAMRRGSVGLISAIMLDRGLSLRERGAAALCLVRALVNRLMLLVAG